MAQGSWVRPTILELGGKNPTIVTRHADLEAAAVGITRSAFGLQGQKCSAGSRVFIEAPVYDELVAKLVALTEKMSIGDPTEKASFLGPVVNKSSYRDYQGFVEELRQAGTILTGGKVLTEGKYARGFFCAPTLAELPYDHRLWKHEMFVPITTVGKFESLEWAMDKANDVMYGLTAGFYGSEEEVAWLLREYRSWCDLRQPPDGRHYRRLAGLPALWWMERLGFQRQECGRSLLPAVVHARTNPEPRPKGIS